jgi:uncharacterized protein
LDSNWLQRHGLQEISKDHYHLFSKYIKSTTYFTGLWASNFTYIWSLSQLKNVTVYWKVIDDMLTPFILTKKKFMYIWCLPFGNGDAEDVLRVTRRCLLLCKEWNDLFHHQKRAFVNLMNERQLQFISKSVLFRRSFSFKKYRSKEILWSIPKVTQLKGKEFNDIRSLRNKLRRNNPSLTFRKYTSADYEALVELKEMWNKTSGKKYKKITDTNLFYQVLHHYQDLRELVFVATIEEKVVGFVTGSILPNGLSWGCIAKAHPAYKGLSEFLYTEFAKEIYHKDPEVVLLHVGSDNNQEGLRRFKEKFRPVEILDLYALRLR